MPSSYRFESYIAGSVMILLGILLLTLLLGYASLNLLPALFLVGVGVIFLAMALLKSRSPAAYELSARTTLAYGVILFVVGILWTSLSLQTIFAGYVLAVALIFFGLIFLAYTRVK